MAWVMIILLQFYKWNIDYALSKDNAARRAVYFFTSLTAFAIIGAWVLISLVSDNQPSEITLFAGTISICAAILLYLFHSFIKDKQYERLHKSFGKTAPDKETKMLAVTIVYLVACVSLFVVSMIMTYLKFGR